MITCCPHCQKDFEFSRAQMDKLQTALTRLPANKKLTLTCIHCKRKLALDKDGNADIEAKIQEQKIALVKPPGPPDMEWLQDDSFTEEEKLEDIPSVLVLHPTPSLRHDLVRTLEQMGYKTFVSSSFEDALQKMQFINFACVVLHSKFSGTDLGNNSVHKTMQQMAMSRRRYIFYILIGPEFNTLYDLQALANSANLTINDRDVTQFGVIMRKAIPAYEDLFAPIMEEVGSYGGK